MATENGLVLAPSRAKMGSNRKLGLFGFERDKTVWVGMQKKGRVSTV